MMDQYTNVAAWMIAGGRNAPDPEAIRNGNHLRALKESRRATVGLAGRVRAAVTAFRSGEIASDAAGCPA